MTVVGGEQLQTDKAYIISCCCSACKVYVQSTNLYNIQKKTTTKIFFTQDLRIETEREEKEIKMKMSGQASDSPIWIQPTSGLELCSFETKKAGENVF